MIQPQLTAYTFSSSVGGGALGVLCWGRAAGCARQLSTKNSNPETPQRHPPSPTPKLPTPSIPALHHPTHPHPPTGPQPQPPTPTSTQPNPPNPNRPPTPPQPPQDPSGTSAEPALLDVLSITPERVLLLDAYFYVVLFHGATVAQWRRAEYHLQPEHKAFAELLAAPQQASEGGAALGRGAWKGRPQFRGGSGGVRGAGGCGQVEAPLQKKRAPTRNAGQPATRPAQPLCRHPPAPPPPPKPHSPSVPQPAPQPNPTLSTPPTPRRPRPS